MADPARTITDLTEYTIGDLIDTDIWFGADDSTNSISRKVSLAELKKTGVQVVNVLQYGADPTGVADSTVAIQDAIDAIPSAGGVVFVPIGVYKVTDTITIEDKGPLIVMGQSTNHVLGSTSTHSSQIMPDAAFTVAKAVFDVVSNAGNNDNDHGGVTFNGLMVRPESGVRGYGINVRKGTSETSFWGNVRLDNVCLRNCSVGFRLTNAGGVGYGWVYVQDSRIEGCTYGIWSDCIINNTVIRDSIIRQNTASSSSSYTVRTGGGVILPYGESLLIEGCDLEGQQVGLQTTGLSVISIIGNYFEGNYDASLVLVASNDVTIEGNIFYRDTKCGQIYLNNCINVDMSRNENAVPVLVNANRDVFCDAWSDVILSSDCVAQGTTTATQTVSGMSHVFYTERGATRLTRIGREATQSVSLAPQLSNASITQGTEGPDGQTSLVSVVSSTGASGRFMPYWLNTVSATAVGTKSFSVVGDSVADTITTTAAHGFIVGEQVSFVTSGTLPTGISTAKWYYVTSVGSSVTFTVSAAHGGTTVKPSTAGSGTLYVTNKGEFVTRAFWVNVPSSNTTTSFYSSTNQTTSGVGGADVYFDQTFSSTVVPSDQWLLMHVITKLPVGVVIGDGGFDTNTRIVQVTSGNVTHCCGIGCCKSRNPFATPKYLSYFTDVAEEILQRLDERHYIYTGAPTSTVFNWAVGTQIEYLTPTSGGNIGLVCTAAGTPGTWKTFGVIA